MNTGWGRWRTRSRGTYLDPRGSK